MFPKKVEWNPKNWLPLKLKILPILYSRYVSKIKLNRLNEREFMCKQVKVYKFVLFLNYIKQHRLAVVQHNGFMLP